MTSKYIGLIDVDGHNFPNLALMKISAYHKRQGDNVEWWNGLKRYDRVYQAKVFDDTYSKDLDFIVMADEIIKGGTGYTLQGALPDEIEHIYPDYSIYDKPDTAYGFLTRGCPRGCRFCIVGEKEGLKSHKVADLKEFWKDQKYIEILDPNILASEEAIDLLKQVQRSGAKVNYNQGLDIRFMTDEACEIINNTRIDIIHFAWDNYELKTYEALKKYRPKLRFNRRKLAVYVLTNFNTSHEQDIERVMKLKELDYDPYVMIYNKPEAPKKTRELQRYVNNKFIFRSVHSFDEYKAGKKNER